MNIPKGNTKEDVIARRKIIKDNLSKYVGKTIYCPCLGVDVYVSKSGIDEITHHASTSYNSTLSAIDLKRQLTIASFYRCHLPKANKQTKQFQFVIMYELYTKNSKIIVGARITGKVLQYCITAQQKEEHHSL